MRVLRLDTSAQTDNSQSRALVTRFLERLGTDTEVVQRDLSKGVPLIGSDWLSASFTDSEKRDSAQHQTLATSQKLVGELQETDLLLIGLPIYNFNIPASLKLWIDQVCRANLTFKQTPDGPVGLLEGKRAVVFFVSGGTRFESDADFASDYVRFVLRFIGITDVKFVRAEAHMFDDGALAKAEAEIDQISREIAEGCSATLAG